MLVNAVQCSGGTGKTGYQLSCDNVATVETYKYLSHMWAGYVVVLSLELVRCWTGGGGLETLSSDICPDLGLDPGPDADTGLDTGGPGSGHQVQ